MHQVVAYIGGLTLVAVSSLLIVACGGGMEQRNRQVYACTCEQADSVLAFVERSIGPANNRSDEEMEDVIAELRFTGIQLRCTRITVTDYRKTNGWGDVVGHIRTEVPEEYARGCWRVFP